MYILQHLRPKLHRFLFLWTAGTYEEIRKIQEHGGGSEKIRKIIDDFLEEFDLLPKTKKAFTHYSKDSSWSKRLKKGDIFEPKSFMSCAVDGSDFVYASTPRLRFTASIQSKFLGALTRECFEREVLIPAGAKFKVTDVISQVVYLSDLEDGAEMEL